MTCHAAPFLMIAALLVLQPGPAGAAAGEGEPDRSWELVSGAEGPVKLVFVPPEEIEDEDQLARIFRELARSHPDQRPFQVMIFDDRAATPRRWPLTHRQMLSWRARYFFNPESGYEEFAWIDVIDPETVPPTLGERPASISRASAR
jgi:hypothetical protein